MSRADATYSNNSRSSITRKRRPAINKFPGRSVKDRTAALPNWVPFAVAGSITVMLCLTINFRAFTELRQETQENQQLSSQIQTLTTENLTLQEEIFYLKNDSQTIEREARKFGLKPREEKKVSVPTK